MAVPMIQTKNLKKYFNTKKGVLHAVDGVDISINKGETLGVVGESGCGKSTLGRVILKLIEPTEGEVFFEGNDISKYNKKQMKAQKKEKKRRNVIYASPCSKQLYQALFPVHQADCEVLLTCLPGLYSALLQAA